VSVGPPGTSTFTVIGLPSSSFAHTADMDFECCLGRAIGQHSQHGAIARGVVDDAPEPSFSHQWQGEACKYHWCAHDDGKEAIPNFRCQLLDAGMAHLGVGPDRTHANAGVINQGFDRAEAFARDFDCMRATRFRAQIGEDWTQALRPVA